MPAAAPLVREAARTGSKENLRTPLRRCTRTVHFRKSRILYENDIRLSDYVFRMEPDIAEYLENVWETMVAAIKRGLNFNTIGVFFQLIGKPFFQPRDYRVVFLYIKKRNTDFIRCSCAWS